MAFTLKRAVAIVMDAEKGDGVMLVQVEYGEPGRDLWRPFVKGLKKLCAAQGWELEMGGDEDRSLAIFAGSPLTMDEEIAIEMEPCPEESLILWRARSGKDSIRSRILWKRFVTRLRRFCGKQGWIVECGDDAYHEHSLAIFAQGFSTPDTKAIKAWEAEHIVEMEE